MEEAAVAALMAGMTPGRIVHVHLPVAANISLSEGAPMSAAMIWECHAAIVAGVGPGDQISVCAFTRSGTPMPIERVPHDSSDIGVAIKWHWPERA